MVIYIKVNRTINYGNYSKLDEASVADGKGDTMSGFDKGARRLLGIFMKTSSPSANVLAGSEFLIIVLLLLLLCDEEICTTI